MTPTPLDGLGPTTAGGRMPGDDPLPPTVEWLGDRIVVIDQRELPGRLVRLELRTVDDVCQAIRSLVVRGAPAIGAAGAFGLALAAVSDQDLRVAAEQLRATRPT